MKNAVRIYGVILLILSIFLIYSCEPEKPPTLSTTAVTAISYTTATSGGEVTSDGGAAVTARGVCWNTSLDPTTTNNKTTDGTGTGSFNSSLTGLIAGTTYYVRAYATNSAGTGYGSQITFTTSQIALAALTTTAITAITQTTAVTGGNITADNGSSVTARGVCWGAVTNPTTANNKTTDGTGNGSFVSNLISLQPGTIYYVRSYATNSIGTSYGNEISFTTTVTLPVLTTTAASSITQTTATSGGNVTSDGGASVTARGVCWNTATIPTTANSKTIDGSGTGSFASSLTGLTPNTTYYLRAYATNSVGTAYGTQASFTTDQVSSAPTATTNAASSVSQTGATLNGTVNANNQSTTVTFEYGTTTSYGQTINAIPNTVSGSTNTTVSANLTGLTTSTMYHYRVKAVSSSGTTYGSDVTFTTLGTGGIIFNPNLTYGSVSDNDGNTYKTILIGTQTWMAENLKTTKYNDGTAISNVTNNTTWTGLTTGAYCWYNNDAATNKATYGALYNWLAVDATANGGKNVCPTGWHVPTDAEWTTMTTYLGGESVAGGKLKETGTTHWRSPNTGATNETGFTALPGGYRTYFYGTFYDFGNVGDWWEAPESSASDACSRATGYDRSVVSRNVNDHKLSGLSVRCLRGEGQVLPAVTTNAASAITSTSATCGGNITSDGGASVTARGVCWNTATIPTTANSKTTDGSGTGSFASSLTGLTANTTYYVRAYATNSAGTAYGDQLNFTTSGSPGIPILTTTAISVITSTSATSGGNVTSDGGASVTARGVCWSTTANPTVANSKTTDGTGTGVFTSSITGLNPNTAYYVRAYATNSTGTAYGTQVSFTTSAVAPVIPTLTTTAASSITSTTATSGGNITSDGGAAVTARGVCWSTSANPTTTDLKTTDGTGTGSFTSSITGLAASTTYYVRAYATNSVGTAYGTQVSFTTIAPAPVIPVLTTTAASSITQTTATSGGNVTSDGGASVTARGVCWSTTANPTVANSKTTDGTGTGAYTSSITGLNPNTAYYVRAYATNSLGTAYGTQVSFTTSSGGQTGTVTDTEGNTYSTITIGTQTWMAENLKTTKYNDGTTIPLVTDGAAWAALSTPGYCWYNNDAATYKATYGALYNWYTVNTGKLCPTGWHVPTDAEWTTLTTYLGVESGDKLKESGTAHWLSQNTGATNSSGFTALPGGGRSDDGTYSGVGGGGSWWSSTESPTWGAWFRSMSYNYSDVYRNSYGRKEQGGLSVRCLRD